MFANPMKLTAFSKLFTGHDVEQGSLHVVATSIESVFFLFTNPSNK
jgi:hypothetical protein